MKKREPRKELREWVGRHLGTPVGEAMWRHLDGYVKDVVEGEPSAEEDLLEEARSFRRCELADRQAGANRTRKQRPRTGREPRVPRQEYLRAQVLATCLGRIAVRTPEVRGFRMGILKGLLLTPEQAGALLDSDLPRLFTMAFLEEHSIPLVGHDSWVVAPLSRDKRAVLRSARPASLKVRWGKKSERLQLTKEQLRQIRDPHSPRLAILSHNFGASMRPNEYARLGRCRLIPGSVFDALRAAANALVNAFEWTEEAATWYVLTNIVPPSSPIEARPVLLMKHHTRLRFQLTVDSWISHKTLVSAYKQMQEKYVGRPNRPFREKSLKLVDAIERVISRGEGRPSWNDIRLAWNKKHPQWAYSDRCRLRRDYLRTRRGILRSTTPRLPTLLGQSSPNTNLLTTTPPRASM